MAEPGYNRKSSTREDPRLVRQDKNSAPSKKASLYDGLVTTSKHKIPEPTISSNTNTWQGQQGSYTQSIQSAYQHLPPTMYTDVRFYFILRVKMLCCMYVSLEIFIIRLM